MRIRQRESLSAGRTIRHVVFQKTGRYVLLLNSISDVNLIGVGEWEKVQIVPRFPFLSPSFRRHIHRALARNRRGRISDATLLQHDLGRLVRQLHWSSPSQPPAVSGSVP